ncbi:GNAT family N-acetyltransferase [Anoxynatronum sibiricum]|uniref:GNAT family N-acetyltransferase n=1 Tax=Anoxynatronum sibiricum TaxID=210623 RepID=A0ABU9VNV1_9CLOT
MSDIRKLTQEDKEAFKRLTVYAYAGKGLGIDAYEKREKMFLKILQRGEEDCFKGFFEDDGSLTGTVRVLTQPLNFRGNQLTALGIATLAADLFHKKEKIAFKLIKDAVEHAVEKGAAMAVLDPFNIGFYRNMGFGLGAQVRQYRLKPSRFFNYSSKEGLVELSPSDIGEIKELYDRYYETHHGMMKQSAGEIEDLLQGDHIMVGFRKKSQLEGLLIFTFKRVGEDTVYGIDLMVDEMVTLTTAAFQAFSTFLHSQADQVREVLLETQDPHFSEYFDDPSSDDFSTFQTRHQEICRLGVGMMYRVINMEHVLGVLTEKGIPEAFPNLCIDVKDRLLPNQEGAYYLYKEGNQLAFSRQSRVPEVTMTIDIADFSALVMGSVKLGSLLFSGKVTLSNHKYLPVLAVLLDAGAVPVCLSRF